MTVTVAINGTTLNPQPAEVRWESTIVGGRLSGLDAIGAYETVTLRAPVERGGTANWNWSSFENSVLTSVVLPARFTTMRDTGVTYSSGAVAKRIQSISNPVGGIIEAVEMQIMVVI